MREKLIAYFAGNHLLSNLILLAVLAGGFASLKLTHKEARPNLQFDSMSINTRYPGSTPDTAERLVARPLEDLLKSIQGIEEITSHCTEGGCSTDVLFEPDYPDKAQLKSDIRNAVLTAPFPAEVTDLKNNPEIRERKTSNIPLIDIGIYYKEKKYLDDKSRARLQELALVLENELTGMSEISEVTRRGYLQPEIQVIIHPSKLRANEISFNEIISAIRKNSLLYPAGNIRTRDEMRVSLDAELTSVKELNDLIIQGSFSGSNFVRLRHLARVKRTFEENHAIFKVNGREGMVLSLIKSQSHDILKAREKVFKTVERFQKEILENESIQTVYIDDESRNIRNRLSIITSNGLAGFVLIMVVLFFFLDFRSGFWVGAGIPFTLAFTLVCISLFGYTINSLTLAGIIIVMGMVVDDAIIVAENINRHSDGNPMKNAVEGTSYMILPITASILTTIIAFTPLFFIPGRMGQFVEILPVIIIFMLSASLFESVFILPGHLAWRAKGVLKFLTQKREGAKDWFIHIENIYEKILLKSLHHRVVVIAAFLTLMVVTAALAYSQFKFVLFPREEATEFFITGEAPEGYRRRQTAVAVEAVEKILHKYLISEGGKEVMSYMTSVAKDRRGSSIEENKFTITLEIPHRHLRHRPADEMFQEWKNEFEKIDELKNLKRVDRRYGSSSGAAVELLVQSNSDKNRNEALLFIMEKLSQFPGLERIERENSILATEYRLKLKRDNLTRLSVDPEKIGPTLRSILEGVIAVRFYEGDEEVAIRVLADAYSASNISSILDIPVENQGAYLVPLRQLVRVEPYKTPMVLTRKDYLKTETIYADIKGESITPLEIAERIENEIFPPVRLKYPNVRLNFAGEIEESRETGSHMKYVYAGVVTVVFIVLALLFHSITKPLVIMIAVPFGVMGVMLTLFFHGKLIYGFFTIIGALGLTGVVVNDSIVMVNKLEQEKSNMGQNKFAYIASIAKTRLKAIVLTTLTTAAGMFPTAYGIGGYDAFLSDMMLVMGWGLVFATLVTLILIPVVYSFSKGEKEGSF